MALLAVEGEVLPFEPVSGRAVVETLPVETDQCELFAVVLLVALGAGALPVRCVEAGSGADARAELYVAGQAICVRDGFPQRVACRAV